MYKKVTVIKNTNLDYIVDTTLFQKRNRVSIFVIWAFNSIVSQHTKNSVPKIYPT